MHAPPAMTFMPSASARATAFALSAPGCIQRCLKPRCPHSSTTRSVMAGGVMMETPWMVKLGSVARFALGRGPEATPEAGRDGFLILFGSGIRAGVRLTSATVADVTPTVLVLAGEPIARDMDGRVLAEAFDERFAGSASIPIVTTFEPGGSK